MLTATAAHAYARRDLWLCLARAFAPPGGADYLAAVREALPEDLASIGDELGLALGPETEALRAAAAGLADPVDLQRLYAALFLTPPIAASLNSGLYLDGGMMGDSTRALEEIYGRHGLSRHTHFRDLTDSVGVQAEFLGQLYGRAGARAEAGDDMEAKAYLAEADGFAARFPARWATPFLRDVERASQAAGANRFYAHLARVLWLAVEAMRVQPAAPVRYAGLDLLPPGSARGIGALSAEDLAEIAVRLEGDGLGWEHIKTQPNWDDAVHAARRTREANAA